MDLYVLLHESSHALDYAARPDIGSPFSGTSAWQDAYLSDSASPTPYGQGSWVEGYAEIGPLGFYDKHVPGGLGNIQPNKQQVCDKSLVILRHGQSISSQIYMTTNTVVRTDSEPTQHVRGLPQLGLGLRRHLRLAPP